jgi:hypothetical protein
MYLMYLMLQMLLKLPQSRLFLKYQMFLMLQMLLKLPQNRLFH